MDSDNTSSPQEIEVYEIRNSQHATLTRLDDIEKARAVILKEPAFYIHYSTQAAEIAAEIMGLRVSRSYGEAYESRCPACGKEARLNAKLQTWTDFFHVNKRHCDQCREAATLCNRGSFGAEIAGKYKYRTF